MITEFIKETKEDSGFREIELYRREGINCSRLNERDINVLLTLDLEIVEHNYEELVIPEVSSKIEKRLERIKTDAKRFAKHKWKTERRQNQYVEEQYKYHLNRLLNEKFKHTHLSFDFDIMQGTTTTCSHILTYDDTKEDCINKIAIELVKNIRTGYWKKATGYRFCYTATNNSYLCCFRPRVEFIVDDETRQEIKSKQEKLINEVREFYKTTKYCGD